MSLFRHNHKDLPDSDLINQYAQSGNPILLEILFERYGHLTYMMCYKYLKHKEESRDAVMEIFGKLIVDLKKHEIKNFRNWLHSVTKNYCLKALELKKRRTFVQSTELLENSFVEFSENQDQLDDMENLSNLLEKALDTLKSHQRTCLELFYLKDKSYQDIADQTDYSIKQIKSYIQNGKRNLRMKMLELLGGRNG